MADNTQIVNVIINSISLILMSCLLVMTQAKRQKEKNTAAKLYRWQVVMVFTLSLSGLLLEFLEGHLFFGAFTLAMFLETVLELSIDLSLVIWFLYTFVIIFNSRDYFKRKVIIFIAPLFIDLVLDAVNLFTGILWYFDDELVYHEVALYTVRDIIRYVYLFLSVYHFVKYNRENRRKQFFSVWIYIIPLLAGSVIEWTTKYTAFTLGAAIGTLLLYLMFREEKNYKDGESGFYNNEYLNRLYERTKEGKTDPHTVMRYRIPKGCDPKAFCSELEKCLPDGCDTIRTDERAFLTVFYGNTGGLADIISEDIQLIGEELKTDIELEIFTKNKQELSVDFLKSIVKP